MRLLILLFFVSNFAFAQKQRGFQVSVEYGVDRDISTYYNSLPELDDAGLRNTSIRSRHPMKVSVDYFIKRGKIRYHLTGNILNRTLQNFSRNTYKTTGYTNHTMYALGLGISKFYQFKQKFEYEFGMDLLAGYYNSGITVVGRGGGPIRDGEFESFSFTEIQFRSYGIDGGSIIPMFNLYNQIAIPIASDTNLLIGLGLNGQMNKAFSYDINVIEINIPQGQLTGEFKVGEDFFMWFPYLKVGIQI